MDDERIIRWLEADQHVKLTTANTTFCLGLALQPSGKIMGIIYLDFTDESHLQARLRVYISRKLQWQGFAAEAVNSVLKFCFEMIGLHRIIASCDSRNVAAQRLFEKVGMRREGQFRKDHVVDGEWMDTVWNAILAEEYHPAS